MNELKLTKQELKVIDYLEKRSGLEVAWEELAQFSKNPQEVKLKTIQRIVSDIKRKYAAQELPITFDVKFFSLSVKNNPSKSSQTLVQVKRTTDGNIIRQDNNIPQVQIDFKLDKLGFHKVITRSGSYQLNDNEWNMFLYFYKNSGRLISISELRDKLVYPNYGSKLPPRWFDAIMRIINNLRRQVDGISNRLLTVKGSETSYIFQ